jgi:hypothetical protein
MQRTLLALALIATAGVSTASVSYAQTYVQPQPGYVQPQPGYAQPQTRSTNEPLDSYGHPLIGRNDWVAQPGDRTNAGAAPSMYRQRMNPDMAQAPAPRATPMQNGSHQGTFRDEYGHRYDDQGNRLDGRGNTISPQTR